MTPEDKKLYELALKRGKKRFGSPCQHTHIENGICQNCLRKVITLADFRRGLGSKTPE